MIIDFYFINTHVPFTFPGTIVLLIDTSLADPRVHPHPPLTSTKRSPGRSRRIVMIKTMARFFLVVAGWSYIHTPRGEDAFIHLSLPVIAVVELLQTTAVFCWR